MNRLRQALAASKSRSKRIGNPRELSVVGLKSIVRISKADKSSKKVNTTRLGYFMRKRIHHERRGKFNTSKT